MQTVKVRLRKPSRVFTFLSNNIPLSRNDYCVVKTDRGLEYGICVTPPEVCTAEDTERFKMNVVRRATPHDEDTHTKIDEEEVRAKTLCRDRITSRNLPMKLVECEYMFDRKKIVFYFTAEERVDFRALVRDLAQDLKTRIELRHIQVRDEAKIIGGIGSCGRELCCTTWMREFIPISMRMAKRQNLSLNPSKISGQCGRLLCCLSYENDQYGRAKRAHARESEDLAAVREAMEDDPETAIEEVFGPDVEPVTLNDDADLEPVVIESPPDDAARTPPIDETAPDREPPGAEDTPRGPSDTAHPAKASSSGETKSGKPKKKRTKRRRGGKRRRR